VGCCSDVVSRDRRLQHSLLYTPYILYYICHFILAASSSLETDARQKFVHLLTRRPFCADLRVSRSCRTGDRITPTYVAAHSSALVLRFTIRNIFTQVLTHTYIYTNTHIYIHKTTFTILRHFGSSLLELTKLVLRIQLFPPLRVIVLA